MNWHSYVANSDESFPVKDVIGKRVKLALIMPNGADLFLWLEGGHTVVLKCIPMIAGDMKTIGMEISTLKPGASFDDMETFCGPQPPHMAHLRGQTFDGFDNDVVLFSGGLGIQLFTGGVRFAKEVSKEDYDQTPQAKRLRFRK